MFTQYKKDLISYGIWRPVAEILSNPQNSQQKDWHRQQHSMLVGRTLTGSSTAVLSDDGAMITYNSATAGSLTITNDTIGGWTGVNTILIYQSGSGSMNITAGSGVTLRNPMIVTQQYGFLVIRRVGANEWVLT